MLVFYIKIKYFGGVEIMTKLFRKIISIMLVVCMIFTSQAFVTFAEGMENTEAIVKETTIEETTVKETIAEETTAEETTVKETEETTVETTVKETIIGENSDDSANNELVSPDVDEKEESTETDYAEELEEDEIETETRMGEPEDKETIIGENSEDSANNELISPDADEKEESTETEYTEEPGEDVEETTAAEEVEVDTSEDKKIYNEIYGDDDRTLDHISELEPPPVKNYYVGDKYDLTGYKITAWYDDESFENIVYADNKSRFTFEPDYVNNPFTASTPEGEPVEMEITYTDTEGSSASYTKAIQVHPAPASDKNFYVLYYANDADYSTWTLSESHINSAADETEKENFISNLFDEIYNLSAAEPRGFYIIGDGSTGFDIDIARQTYNRFSEATIELEKENLLAEYESWVDGGAEYDVYYGTLINTYFYLLYYDSDGNPAFIKVKCTDTEDTVNAYLATIKGSAPSGKRFKTWQYWHADWYEEEGYDFSDDGEKEFYKNLVEDSSNFETDEQVIETFDGWKVEPYENRHYGAIYEDTPFMYWKIDGDDANKTIHYYASAGEGRTAVTIGTDGIEYTGLEASEKEIIKKAVIEEPIVATDVRKLFSYFKGLVSITNLGNLDTSNATSFKAMFEHCEAIEKIETSGLETDSLTDTSYMFTYCTSATEIILDDNFDTSNVTSMREMFNTTGAVELDLTNFDTSNVTDMYGMFSSCENLETIRVSDKFVVDKVSTSNGKYMFANCDKLVGEKGTKIADLSSPYGVVYAHIDEGSTNPGLFSGASAPTPTTYTVTYNQNLPSGYTISTSKTWYTDSTSDDLSSNPIKISGSAGMTCENADGYVRKLEAWNTLADKSGTPYMFAENIDSPSAFTSNPLTLYAVWGDPVVPTPGTDKFYIISYGNPTEYPNEKKIFAFDSTTTVEEMENFVANNISKCINPSGKAANGFYDMSELIPVGADDTQVRQILNDNYERLEH